MANEKMKNTALFVVSLLFSLFLAELALRAFNVLPYHQRHGLTRGEPQVLDRDADLGWVLRPGRFVWKAPAPGTQDLVFTIGADRMRITGKGGVGTRPEIAMIGGSTLFGWACPTSRRWRGSSRKSLSHSGSET